MAGLPLARSGAAVILDDSSVDPVTDAYDHYQFTANSTVNNGQDYSDNSGPPGQTFTTPGGGANYTLTVIGFKGSGQADGSIGQSGWAFRISSVSGSTPTPISTFGIPTSLPGNFGLSSSNWLLLSLTDSDFLSLLPSTTYAIEAFSDSRWWGFGEAADGNYAGGSAFNSNSGQRSFSGTSISLRGRDRAFFVDLTPVPEPSAAMLGWAALGIGALRRRR